MKTITVNAAASVKTKYENVSRISVGICAPWSSRAESITRGSSLMLDPTLLDWGAMTPCR
jgi:hypothetical protein